ncbi:hypothetical protein V1508DRAFT_458039 [Lipomyces doorenjongii]|uniref:uncharacterized protein n=1 Tax=Lipomyces doorenjongii TaxID=383834 RepID=UPI0034CF2E60
MDTIVAGSSTTTQNSPGLRDQRDQSDVDRGKRSKLDSSPDFSRSPTDVSSTTTVTMSMDKSPQKNERGGLSDYDRAIDLLKNNPPEQRLDFHLPYFQYLKLEDCWSKMRLAENIPEDQKYPYLAYDSAAEIATVVTVPRDLHEGPALELGMMFMNGARDYLSSHGADASLVRCVHNAGSTTFKGIYGSYARSKKQADGAIVYTPFGGHTTIMIAIEVGYSQDYTALCRNKDQWIEGRHVKVCVLVRLDESPRFRNPRTLNESIVDVEAEMEKMGRSMAESVIRDHSRGYYGSIEYRDHKWVGDLTEVFIEVWRVNKRQPVRYQPLQNAWSCNRLPKTIGLKVSDFVPDLKAANIPDSSLSFDAILYVDILRRSLQTTAEERYLEFISP